MQNRHNALHAAAKAWRRERVAAYKLSKGCADCGYANDHRALQLDHLPGTTKVDDVSSLVSARALWHRIQAEMEKCEVVCANCHAIRTDERRKDMLREAEKQIDLTAPRLW